MKKENQQKLLQRFRSIAIAEGISFLVLLCIAMPLKYFFHTPLAVKIFGWVHGVLFVGYIYSAFEIMGSFKKEWSWFAKAITAGILPFGTFIFDRQLKKKEQSLQA